MPQNGQTVYIIDDDDSVRRALRRLIRSVGVHVETFATAEEFLRCSSQSARGCLILDMHLPGMSGLELQERLNGDGRGLPIVIITAYPEEPARVLALGAGAIAFLKKPFEEHSLLDAVKQALGP